MSNNFSLIIANSFQIYQDYGIKCISMDDLCKQLKISKKTIYKFVANKEDLLKHIFLEYVPDIFNKKYESASGSKNAIEKIYYNKNLFFVSTTELSESVKFDLEQFYPHIFAEFKAKIKEIALKHLEENITEGKSQNLYSEDFNAELYSKIFLNFDSLDADYSPEEIQKELIYIFFKSTSTDLGFSIYNSLCRNDN